MDLRLNRPHFANGRSVRNALDRARMRQAIRLFNAAEAGQKLTKGDLVTIEAEDIRASRVFDDMHQTPDVAQDGPKTESKNKKKKQKEPAGG